MDRLAGKRVLLTGAGGGIGGLLAKKLALKGCQAVLVDINEAALRARGEETGPRRHIPVQRPCPDARRGRHGSSCRGRSRP